MKNEKKPLISICIAVYNLEKYIEQCLESILSQEFKDYEILLYDNGSSDRSIEICEKYAQEYSSYIRFKQLPNPTIIGRPWRTGIIDMEGRYYMVVDGDDYITEGSLQRIADAIKLNDSDIIMGTFICDAEEGMSNFKDADFDEQKINNVYYNDALQYLSQLPNFHSVQWRYIIKTSVIKKVTGGKKKKEKDDTGLYGRYNDTLHVCAFLDFAESIYYMKEPFYVYRRRGGSLTGVITKNQNTVIDFLKFVLTLAKWESDRKSKNINVYKKSQVDIKFNIFRLACNLNTFQENYELARLIDNYYKYFKLADKYNTYGYHEFYECVKKYGALEGVLLYQKKQTIKCLKELGDITNKHIYIFPTGICGEATAELLKKEEIEITGFLDNDIKKDNMIFGEVLCSLPKKVSEFDLEKKENTIVIVATAYRELREILNNQLVEYGIPKDNIILR